MTVNFSDIPDATFADLDTAAIESGIINLFQQYSLRVLYPGDPIRLLLTTIAAVIGQQRVLINDTGQQNMLRYARAEYLDNLGALLDVQRLAAAPSHCNIQFIIQQTLPFAFVIPMGTRTTSDGITYFATDAEATIPAGGWSVTAPSTCQSTGVATNGLAIGQITRLVDPLPYVTGVTNIDAPTGGIDVESDDSLRTRIQLAPEAFSTAGSGLSYKYWGLSASPNIMDVSVTSPVPGVVNLFVMLQGGQVPATGAPELQLVYDACSASNRRPLTDSVYVYPVTPVPVAPVVQWFLTSDQQPQYATISERISQAADLYYQWQIAQIGRDINTQRLIRLLIGAGAKRVVISGITDMVLDDTQIAQFTAPIKLIYGGGEPE